MKRRFIAVLIITLCLALLLSSWGCKSEGRDSGSGIWGRLRSIGIQAPVANLKLSVDGVNILGATDSTGYFRLDGIPAGNYGARFYRYDALIAKIDFAVTEEQALNKELIQLSLPAHKTGTGNLSGVVLNDKNEPVVGAEIILGLPDRNILITYANDMGAYGFSNLELVGGYAIVVSIKDYDPESANVVLGPTGSSRVNFQLEPIKPPAMPHGNIDGRVVDGDGIPLGDAYVIIYPRNAITPVIETTGEIATDINGKFKFGDVIEGPYVLWVGKSGHGIRAQEIYVTDGLTWQGDVVLNGTYSVSI
jgi:hypothetical protein